MKPPAAAKHRRTDSARPRAAFATLVWILLAVAGATPAQASEITAVRFEEPPAIDGKLDDPVWESAARVSGFVQVRPFNGQPSPQATEVLLGYDDAAVYVAFRCRDANPRRIAAAVTARDGDLGADDSVVVMLDTFHDGNSGYYFGTNLLGTQFDGTLTNNGRTVDSRWDATWQNAAAPTDSGWTAELRIPFDVLRYAAGEGRTWGVNFQRVFPRHLETSVWAGPGQSEWRISPFGTLSGLAPEARGSKWWEIIPYVLGVADMDGETDGEAGGDVRLRMKSSLTADLTVNPDFALIEADVEQINLSRFELFIPEKRPFFLEGNERFSQRIRQFYSRRIEDINFGAKAAGNVKTLNFVALGTASELGVEPPGGGSETLLDANYGVVRLQKPVMKSGNVGFLAANRHLQGSDSGSAGIDTTLFFNDEFGLTAQYLRSHGPDGRHGSAWFVRPAYDSTTLHFHVRLTNLDENILQDVNAVGFLRDDNRREFDTNLTRTWWFEKSAVEKLEAGMNYNRYCGQDGTLRSYVTDAYSELNFSNRWNLELSYVDEFKLFEQEYQNNLAQLAFGYDNRAGRSFRLAVSTGKNFGDDFWLYEGTLEFRFSDAWNLSYELTHLDATPDLSGRTTWIHVLRTTYYFNNNLFVKLLAQTNSAIDKENVQALVVWRVLPPFGSIQFAYQRGTSELGEQSEQGDTFFAKVAWVF